MARAGRNLHEPGGVSGMRLMTAMCQKTGLSTPQRRRVWNLRVEHHLGIARYEVGIALLALFGFFFLAAVLRIQHGLAHLAVVLQRHLRDRIGIGSPFVLERLEQSRPTVMLV